MKCGKVGANFEPMMLSGRPDVHLKRGFAQISLGFGADILLEGTRAGATYYQPIESHWNKAGLE